MINECEPRAGVRERTQLINVAYRLLGSLAEAEDAVQETYARWYAHDPGTTAGRSRHPAAWLTTVASRICLDMLGSARVRRERYVGEWIPSRCPNPRNGSAGVATPARSIRPTGSPSTSRSTWPCSWCSTR